MIDPISLLLALFIMSFFGVRAKWEYMFAILAIYSLLYLWIDRNNPEKIKINVAEGSPT